MAHATVYGILRHMRRTSDGRLRRSGWNRAAQLGQAAWLIGNLYEGLVGMPQLLADARPARSPGLLTAGSPVRYYLPIAPWHWARTEWYCCRAGAREETAG